MKTRGDTGAPGVPPKLRRQPTLRTIADLTGLAVPTVSRALSDAPDIGAKTKARVRAVAAEIGYVPNRAGVRLRTGRTNVISLVLATDHDMMNHTARMISAIAGALRHTRYHLNVTPFFPDEDLMRPVRYIVETGSADALILNQIHPEDPRVRFLMDRKFPFAAHGRSVWAEDHPWFDFDNEAFGRIAMTELVARGRRNVLMIAPPMTQAYAQHMAAGARSAAGGARLRFGGDMTSDSPQDLVSDGVRRMLSADSGIDGIICGSSSVPMTVVGAIEALGRTLGRDIDVVGKETVPFLTLFRPDIIAVQEDVTQAGTFLAKAAMQAIATPEAPPMQGLQVPDRTP